LREFESPFLLPSRLALDIDFSFLLSPHAMPIIIIIIIKDKFVTLGSGEMGVGANNVPLAVVRWAFPHINTVGHQTKSISLW
jgi:hypothetical protein